MKKYILFILVSYMTLYAYQDVAAQGCVAIRSGSSCSLGSGESAILKTGQSIVGINFRYFHSFRHFRGTHEEKERVEQGTEVINDSYFTDLLMTYAITDRSFITLVVPFVYHERSSMYEHGGNSLGDRHSTYAQGISDIRISAGYWLLPKENTNSNISFSVGIKLPTGKYDAEGKFYNTGDNGEVTVRPVDQSIQPGDGGLGITLEAQGYHQLSHKFILNGSFYYLLNPREHNGTARRPGASPYASPDQYAVRLGGNYISPIHGLQPYLGGRMECVPVQDLIGGNDAYRRPGYVISVEPGINYLIKNFIIVATVPIAIERNRTQSVLDKQRERETGIPTHGDAAFADYLINLGLSYRF